MPARTEIRAVVAAACAIGLLGAGIALAQAPRWPDADDIERAQKASPSREPIVSVPNRCPRRRA